MAESLSWSTCSVPNSSSGAAPGIRFGFQGKASEGKAGIPAPRGPLMWGKAGEALWDHVDAETLTWPLWHWDVIPWDYREALSPTQAWAGIPALPKAPGMRDEQVRGASKGILPLDLSSSPALAEIHGNDAELGIQP